MISTRWRAPTVSSSTLAPGSTASPNRRERSDTRPSTSFEPRESREQRRPECDVLGHRHVRHEHEVLVHHPEAQLERVLRAVDLDLAAVHEDLAAVGLVQPVDDVHQRRLAGSVLAEQAEDLSPAHVQRDRVVGEHAGECLRDAYEPESRLAPVSLRLGRARVVRLQARGLRSSAPLVWPRTQGRLPGTGPGSLRDRACYQSSDQLDWITGTGVTPSARRSAPDRRSPPGRDSSAAH